MHILGHLNSSINFKLMYKNIYQFNDTLSWRIFRQILVTWVLRVKNSYIYLEYNASLFIIQTALEKLTSLYPSMRKFTSKNGEICPRCFTTAISGQVRGLLSWETAQLARQRPCKKLGCCYGSVLANVGLLVRKPPIIFLCVHKLKSSNTCNQT
jgi:hypothetical protein